MSMPNYYNDGPDESEMPPKSSDQEEPKEEMDEGDEKTAMLPKSVTGGKDFQVGDEIVLEVVAVHEDDLQVKYASEKGGKEEEGEEADESEPSMSRASEKNNSMAYME